MSPRLFDTICENFATLKHKRGKSSPQRVALSLRWRFGLPYAVITRRETRSDKNAVGKKKNEKVALALKLLSQRWGLTGFLSFQARLSKTQIQQHEDGKLCSSGVKMQTSPYCDTVILKGLFSQWEANFLSSACCFFFFCTVETDPVVCEPAAWPCVWMTLTPKLHTLPIAAPPARSSSIKRLLETRCLPDIWFDCRFHTHTHTRASENRVYEEVMCKYECWVRLISPCGNNPSTSWWWWKAV